MYCGHARLCVCLPVCLSVCLSVRGVRPRYCRDTDVTWRHGRSCPLVVHYWTDLQSGHGLRCYSNITRTLVTSLRPSRDMTTQCERPARRGLRALLAADWRVTGGVLNILRRPGLRASSDGVLATKSERKMLASTCLYSLYAWFVMCHNIKCLTKINIYNCNLVA